jgi:hypothetical protein
MRVTNVTNVNKFKTYYQFVGLFEGISLEHKNIIRGMLES